MNLASRLRTTGVYSNVSCSCKGAEVIACAVDITLSPSMVMSSEAWLLRGVWKGGGKREAGCPQG